MKKKKTEFINPENRLVFARYGGRSVEEIGEDGQRVCMNFQLEDK